MSFIVDKIRQQAIRRNHRQFLPLVLYPSDFILSSAAQRESIAHKQREA
jgi:hypothetical protein